MDPSRSGKKRQLSIMQFIGSNKYEEELDKSLPEAPSPPSPSKRPCLPKDAALLFQPVYPRLNGLDASLAPTKRPLPAFKILLQTERSVIWCVENFDVEHSIGDFGDIEMHHHPPFWLRNKQVASRRDIVFFRCDDLYRAVKERVDESFDASTMVTKSSSDAHDDELPSSTFAAKVSFKQVKSVHYKNVRTTDEQLARVNKSHLSLAHSVLKCQDFCPTAGLNAILLNYYANGQEYISSHSDKEVGDGELVLSLSFGATRIFRIRDASANQILIDVPHTSGMLIGMEGACQLEMKHEVPVQKKVNAPRLSITLRRHKSARPGEDD